MRPASLPSLLPCVLLSLVPLLPACAGGRADSHGDGAVRTDLVPALDTEAVPDSTVDRPGPGAERGGLDQSGRADRARDGAPWPRDLAPPDHAPADLGQTCPDPYELNEYCSSAYSLGSIKEGTSWASKTGTVNPYTDADWFTVKGLEEWHFCLPGTSQSYTFTARLSVPSGRKLKICLHETTCGGTPACKDNSTLPAPVQLEVKYKVSGTCAATDDTTANILVHSTDGKGGCVPYTLSYNYQ